MTELPTSFAPEALPRYLAVPSDPKPIRRRYGPHILVSDDDPAIHRLYTTLLPNYGFQVIAVPRGDGVLTLDLARRLHPQLLISDMNKPGMNGHHLREALRSSAATAELPILTVSAVDQGESRDPLADALAKPFNFASLLFRVATLLPLPAAAHAALAIRAMANPPLDRFHPLTGLPFLHSFDRMLPDLTAQPGWAALDLALNTPFNQLRRRGRAAVERMLALLAESMRQRGRDLVIGHLGLDLRLTLVGSIDQIRAIVPQVALQLSLLQHHLTHSSEPAAPPLFRMQIIDDQAGYGLNLLTLRRAFI